jgi:CheY-like chemotaxis protein
MGEIEMKRIAVVDDNQTFCIFVKQILELNNYEVELFASADELFIVKDIQSFALFIIDYNLPGINGITALENIKFNPNTNKIPVVFVTGEPSKELVDIAIRYKVNDFLSKPIDPDLLVQRVNDLLPMDINSVS